MDNDRFNWKILGDFLRERCHPYIAGDNQIILVTVIGTHSSNYFAVVQPNTLSRTGRGVFYLVVPYGTGLV